MGGDPLQTTHALHPLLLGLSFGGLALVGVLVGEYHTALVGRE